MFMTHATASYHFDKLWILGMYVCVYESCTLVWICSKVNWMFMVYRYICHDKDRNWMLFQERSAFAGLCWSASLATQKFRWSVFFKQYQQTFVWRWKLWSKIWPMHWRSHPAFRPVDGGDYADVLDLLETFVRRELLICVCNFKWK